MLKAENDNVLAALENALINTKKKKGNKLNIKDFVGVISKEEAEQLKK